MTIADHFEERIVTFSNADSNEDRDHPGQSITRHCRSYVFQITCALDHVFCHFSIIFQTY